MNSLLSDFDIVEIVNVGSNWVDFLVSGHASLQVYGVVPSLVMSIVVKFVCYATNVHGNMNNNCTN